MTKNENSIPLSGITKLPGVIRAAGSEILDLVGPASRDWERSRHDHLALYAGRHLSHHLVIVGNFDPQNNELEDDATAQSVARLLQHRGVVGPRIAASVRSIMPAVGWSQDNLKRLNEVGASIREAVAGRGLPAPNTDTDEPIFIAEDTGSGNVAGAYERIHRGVEEWENYVEDHPEKVGIKMEGLARHSMILVSDATWPLDTFRGFNHQDIYNGGVVSLHNSRANLWVPIGRPEPPQIKPPETKPRQSTGRFRRDADRQEQAREASMAQIGSGEAE